MFFGANDHGILDGNPHNFLPPLSEPDNLVSVYSIAINKVLTCSE
jgi:hypothetical protein